MDKKYYSVAFKRYRNEVLKDNLNNIMTGICIIIVIVIGVKAYKKYKFKGKGKKVDA